MAASTGYGPSTTEWHKILYKQDMCGKICGKFSRLHGQLFVENTSHSLPLFSLPIQNCDSTVVGRAGQLFPFYTTVLADFLSPSDAGQPLSVSRLCACASKSFT